MMLLSKIIVEYDLTQKILSLLTFMVLPIKAERTCSQEEKEKNGEGVEILDWTESILYKRGKKINEKKEKRKMNERKKIFLFTVLPG